MIPEAESVYFFALTTVTVLALLEYPALLLAVTDSLVPAFCLVFMVILNFPELFVVAFPSWLLLFLTVTVEPFSAFPVIVLTLSLTVLTVGFAT